MADETLDEKLKEANLPKKEDPYNQKTEDIADKLADKEKGSDLEQKTKQGFFSTLKKFSLWDWVKIGATGIAATALSGGFLATSAIINVATTVASYGVGTYITKRKQGMSAEELRSEFYLGAGMTPVLYKFFKTLDRISNPILQTGSALAIGMPLFNLAFLPIRYMFKNYSKPSEFLKRITYKKGGLITLPFELYKNSLKGQYWKSMKKYWKVMTLPITAMLNFIPLQYMLPVSAVTRLAYKYFMEKTIDENKNKEPNSQYPAKNEYLDRKAA